MPAAECGEPHAAARHPGEEAGGQDHGAAEEGQGHDDPHPPGEAHLLGAVAVVEPRRRHPRRGPVADQQRGGEDRQRQQPDLAAAHHLEVLRLEDQADHEERQELQDPLEVQVVADVGETEASSASASASGTGQRTIFHSGVVSRQMKSAIRNQVRYQGSSRLIGWVGSSSAQRLKRLYAVSNRMYGTATPVTSRWSRSLRMSKLREK